MLFLTRRPGQSIFIGDSITLKVMNIDFRDDDYIVNLGIDAPKDIRILREEVARRYERGAAGIFIPSKII